MEVTRHSKLGKHTSLLQRSNNYSLIVLNFKMPIFQTDISLFIHLVCSFTRFSSFPVGWAQFYTNFYGCNFPMFVISKSISHQEPTRVEPLTGRNYNGRLQHYKQYSRVEVNGSSEHSSLLRYGNNYGHKKFYFTCLDVLLPGLIDISS